MLDNLISLLSSILMPSVVPSEGVGVEGVVVCHLWLGCILSPVVRALVKIFLGLLIVVK